MTPPGNQSEKERGQYAFNLTLAAVAGQVGCLTLVIVLAALLGGLWLDNFFKTRPLITIGLMIASVPLTLVCMFWVVRKATAHMQSPSRHTPDQNKEEA